MSRRTTARDTGQAPVLLVPGLGDSEAGHWQTLWHEAHPHWLRVVPADAGTPALDRWAAAVARAIDRLPSTPVVVAHGFGCLAAVRAAHLLERRVAGALLVAPIDPERFEATSRLPSRRLPYPSVIVASSNDPGLKITSAGALAARWGSRLVALSDAGHVNVASGHGRWPDGLKLVAALQQEATRAVASAFPVAAVARPLSAALSAAAGAP